MVAIFGKWEGVGRKTVESVGEESVGGTRGVLWLGVSGGEGGGMGLGMEFVGGWGDSVIEGNLLVGVSCG
jgi:hypothetical protein